MKNLFTPADSAMLLIDHQRGTIKLAISTPLDEIVRNTRALCRTATATGMPLVLTSSQEERFQGLLLDDLQQLAPEAYANRVKRPGVVDCWGYAPFRDAVGSSANLKLKDKKTYQKSFYGDFISSIEYSRGNTPASHGMPSKA